MEKIDQISGLRVGLLDLFGNFIYFLIYFGVKKDLVEIENRIKSNQIK